MNNFNIYEVEKEYEIDKSIFSDEDEKITKLKKIINSIDETEKRIILSYAELGNIRDTAKLFKVSPTTIWIKIKEIRNKVIKIYGTN